MCIDTTDSQGFTEAEDKYIDAVERFLTANRDSRVATEDQIAATDALRDQFEDRVEAITREVELVNLAVDRSVGRDSVEGERALEAANMMLKVEEAVSNGVSRKVALMRAMLLGEDPRTPTSDSDEFKGVSLSGL